MRYYKIIDENQVIGTITDKNFVSYSPLVDSYVHATDETGEYATYKGLFYRSEWMQPINDNFTMYKTVLILNIDEVEYNALTEALASNEIIEGTFHCINSSIKITIIILLTNCNNVLV